MVARRDLNAPAGKVLAGIVADLKADAAQGKTGAAGVVDYGETGDATWTEADGSKRSVRDVAALSDDLQATVDDTRESLGATQGDLDAAKARIEAERVAREAALADATAKLGELDARLTAGPSTGDLEAIRADLGAAREVADSAVKVAGEATTAANAASQAALEAAGIAASKGRVIVSETEPMGEDRNAANIWIRPIPDDPATDVQEKAVTHVYIAASDEWQPTTSSELAQAAQNALDAREAAQQAQQRADTAVANAASAQAAAEAAQRTADKATTDARDAHNEAVAAQERVQAKIDAGDSLILNGGFELGDSGWLIPSRSSVIESEGARTGSRVVRIDPEGANVYPRADAIPVRPGQVIYVQAWFKYLGGGEDSRLSIFYEQHDRDGVRVEASYAQDRAGTGVYVYPTDMTVGEWMLVAGDVHVGEVSGAVSLTVAPHVLRSSAGDAFDLDDVIAVDVTEARSAQAAADEAYTLADAAATPQEVEAAITVSANGKNAVKVSASAPTSSTPGVVAGDTWWRVDGAGNIFGQWTWTGSAWAARTVRSEVIANLDVGKLVVTGESRFAAAVVDRLYADIFAAHKITAEQITIAALDADGNLAPGSVGAITLQDGVVGADKIIAGEVAAEISHLVEARVEKLKVTEGAEINEAVILKLASEMITAGVLRTAEAGQRVVIDGNGIVMYGVDPDGIEYELVRIGPNGDNVLTVGETTVASGGVSTPRLDADTLTVGGDDLSAILSAFPRGRVAQNRYLVNSQYSDRAQSRLSTQFEMQPGRRYSMTVPPFYLQASAATAVEYKVVHSWDSLNTSWEANAIDTGRSSLPDSGVHKVPGLSADINTSNGAGPRMLFLTLMVSPSGGSTPVRMVGRNDYPVSLIVDDVGPRLEDAGSHWTYGNVTEGSTTPPPAQPTTQRYVKTYTATGFRTYNLDGSSVSTSDVVQGLYAGGPSNHRRRGGWTFPTMTGDLAGATVEKVEAYMYMNHSHYAAGATVNPAVWGGQMVGGLSAFTTVYGWKRNAGKWITLPASYHAGFKSGTYAGIGVIPTNGYAEQYARFNAGDAKIRITYTK